MVSLDVVFIRSFWGSGPLDFLYVSSIVLSGGLLIVWDPYVVWGCAFDVAFQCLIVKFSGPGSFLWCLSNVYGSNVVGEKEAFLEAISQIILSCDLPWSGAGDYNLVRSPVEVSSPQHHITNGLI
ncbi:hypothetical protein AMTRI_Chr04g247620 [Amborella trichopoda]